MSKWCLRAFSSARGRTTSCAKFRAVSRISCCSSEREKSMGLATYPPSMLLAVDTFALIMTGIVGGWLLFLIILGIFVPASGARKLDWKPTRSAEVELQNEIDDLDQMLEAANERRRRRGEAELTEQGIRASVGADLAETIKRREDHLAELEVVQMLDAKNARRRAKGLPEITVEEYRAKILGQPRGDGA